MKRIRKFLSDLAIFSLWAVIWPVFSLARAANAYVMERALLRNSMYARHLRLAWRFMYYGVFGLLGLTGFGLLFRLPFSSWLWPLDLVAALLSYSFFFPFWKLTIQVPWFR